MSETMIRSHAYPPPASTGGPILTTAIANHESPKTVKLYDRTGDQLILGEVEWIAI